MRGAGGATGDDRIPADRIPAPAPLVVPMVKDAIRRMAVAERRIEVDMSFLGEDAPEPGERGGQ